MAALSLGLAKPLKTDSDIFVWLSFRFFCVQIQSNEYAERPCQVLLLRTIQCNTKCSLAAKPPKSFPLQCFFLNSSTKSQSHLNENTQNQRRQPRMTQNKGISNATNFHPQPFSHYFSYFWVYLLLSHFDAAYLPSPSLALVVTKMEAVSLCSTPQLSSSRPPSHSPHIQCKTIRSRVPWVIFWYWWFEDEKQFFTFHRTRGIIKIHRMKWM